MKIHRRNFLQMGAGVVVAYTADNLLHMQAGIATKASIKIGYFSIKIGYLPIAAALPLYLALEEGYFRQAGLEVEAVKFSEEQQVVNGLITGQIQGVANGIGSEKLATGERRSPGVLKVIAANTIGGTLNSPWFGGSAALSTQFLQENSEIAKQYIDVYRRAIISIRQYPEKVRQYLVGYTGIKPEHAQVVPLPEYKLHDEFTMLDTEYFQKFLDLLHQEVEVGALMLKDLAIA